MSSKAVGQQQQGRRTPLSLAGGKNNHHQNNANKTNHNSNNHAAKNQEPKDSTSSNKNSNQGAKNQQETRDLPSTQKDNKKTQQNGNKNVPADSSSDDVIFVEQNGTSNSTSNSSNGVSNKSNGKSTNPAVNKDNNEKEKNKEPEPVKEKQEQKPKKADSAAKANEKKQNDANEKQATTATATSNCNKSKDGTSTPTPKDVSTEKNTQAATPPTKSTASSNANRKSSTPSKPESTEKAAATPPKKSPVSATTKISKSPKVAGAAAGSAAIAPVTETPPEVTEINENDIEPLIVESSPPKKPNLRNVNAPTATSTPGKALSVKRGSSAKSDIQLTMDTRSSVERKSVPRSYSDISGRRSIRSVGDYTPSMYNSQFRESYRRINTELDVTGNTNTSMNVTVGSEIPNNSSFLSFSLFGRGRKRERTPPPTVPDKSQSAVELTMETTPPKRARLDVHGIFCAMSSPLTMLRTRFSKATLETPTKVQQPTSTDDVQNVSGISIEEVVGSAEVTATEDITVGKEVVAEKTPSKTTPVKEKETDVAKDLQDVDDDKTAAMEVDGDIKITETPIIPAVGEPKMKQKGCLVM